MAALGPHGATRFAWRAEVSAAVARLRSDRGLLLGLLVPAAVGVLVGAWNLGGKPFSYDETFEALLVMFPPFRFAGWVVTFEASGAFYHSFLWVWKFLGTSEVALRLPSLIFSVAAIPVTYLIARRVLSAPWAFVAGLFLAVSALWLAHAQEARPYGLYLLMATLSTLALLRAIERPDRLRWAVYAVVTVLAMWSHLMMAFVVLAHALAIAVHPDVRRWWRPAALSLAAAAVAGVPIAISIMRSNQARWYWITDPTPQGLWEGLRHLLSDGGYLLTLSWLALLAIGIVAAAWRWRGDRRAAWPLVVVVAWLVVPIVVPWVLSFIRPMYTPRYIFPVLPALFILATFGISRIRPRLAAAGIAGFLVVVGALGVQHWHASLERPDWRTAIRILVDDGTTTDGLAYFYRGAFEPGALYEYRYYLTQIPGSQDRPTLLRLPATADPIEQRVTEAIANYKRLWFIGIPQGLDDETEQQAADQIGREFELAQDFAVPGLTVRLYLRRAAT